MAGDGDYHTQQAGGQRVFDAQLTAMLHGRGVFTYDRNHLLNKMEINEKKLKYVTHYLRKC